MSTCPRALARKSIFNKNYISAKCGDNGETDYYVISDSKEDMIVDNGEEDLLVTPVKFEFLQYRYGILWDKLVFDVVREDGVPVEYICCNDPELVINTAPPFDPEFNDYFSHQQKVSIRMMEKMEMNNALIIESDFFDERVLNNFAIGSKFGMLSNDVGSGKTRIAVAIAFRNLYSQKRTDEKILRRLPITIYREVIDENQGDKQVFKQFFGAKELSYNPIGDTNVNKLGNELEKSNRYKCLDSTLIAVSPSTFHQWKSEVLDMMNKFGVGDESRFLFISSEEDFTTENPIDDPEYEQKTARVAEQISIIDKNEHDIIIMTNKWYNDNLITSPKLFSFNRIFFDEPDTIEYKSSQKIIARFTWLISTTIKQWISDRYQAIKGTTQLAGRDKATRVGESEVCTYDDPSIVEIILDNFLVRDDSSPVDNSKFLNFVKYPVFLDNFYKRISSVISNNSPLNEALSGYNIKELDRILGTERISVMEKIYNYIASNHASNAELTALDLKFGEDTKYAESNVENPLFNVESKNYKNKKEKYLQEKKKMKESIDERDRIFETVDDILATFVSDTKCTFCNENIKIVNECHVSDCCFSLSHSKCFIESKKKDEPTGKVTLRRARKKAAEEVKSEEEKKSDEDEKVVNECEGFDNNNIFKNIIFASGKVFDPSETSAQFVDIVEKGNKVSTKNLFNISRVVAQEKYTALTDVFSEDEVEVHDCRCCGILNARIHPLEKSTIATRIQSGKITESETHVNTKTRQQQIVDMIKNREEEQRFLIYATNGSNVTKVLGEDTPFRIVTGNAYDRERAIVEYRRGEAKILVLLNHENAAGLNLTETTDLVIFNQTSDVIAEQVIGRVDRLGLKHPVNVHLFDTNDNMLNFIKSKYKK